MEKPVTIYIVVRRGGGAGERKNVAVFSDLEDAKVFVEYHDHSATFEIEQWRTDVTVVVSHGDWVKA